MYRVLRSDRFDKWLRKLRDVKGRARIVARIKSAELGNLGDARTVGKGVSEMRIHYGPGYRVYFTKRNNEVIFLLIAGNKSSQTQDIKQAISMAKSLEE